MQDILYLYPKTSSPLGDCKREYDIPRGNQTNLSVEGCQISPYFDCWYEAELKRDVQPRPPVPDNKNWYELNPQAYTDKMSPDFVSVNEKVSQGCPIPTVISPDPRLYDSVRATYLPLDRPPMNGDVKLKDVYDPKYNNYGRGSMPYKNIKDGDITYYIDQSIAGAFYKPVFSEPAEEVLSLYKDPMGAMKPNADRRALVNTENPTVSTPVSYPYSLSYLQDTQSFREDIMALQQRKNNQSKWSVRWV
jgi:hypothetical protein